MKLFKDETKTIKKNIIISIAYFIEWYPFHQF